MNEPSRPAEMFQLDRATCLALLTTQHIGRLVIAGAVPRVVPLNYSLIDGTIVFRSDAGRRADELAGEVVAFEVDMFDERTRSGWSVLVRGVASRIEPIRGVVVEPWAPGPKDIWLSIATDDVSGRLLRGEVATSLLGDDGYL